MDWFNKLLCWWFGHPTVEYDGKDFVGLRCTRCDWVHTVPRKQKTRNSYDWWKDQL